MTRIAMAAAALVPAAAVAAFVWAPGAFAAQDIRLRQSDPLVLLRGDASSIGVSVRDVTTDDVSKAKLDVPRGVFIENVQEGTPAARAGLRSGDIVLEFDGERVRSVQQFTRLVRESAAGRSVSAVVNRDGARQTLNVTPERGAGATALNDLITRRGERNLQRLPNFNLNPDRFPPDIRSFILPRQLGATLTPLSEQLEAYFGVGNGVLVSSVEANSVASAAGLRAGDVITRVNGQQVNAPNDVSQAVRSAGAEINVTVVREKKELTLKARFPERELPSGSRGVAL